ncbi:Inositol phosphatase SIW14 [Elasticomyces elasticus]|nr:Inositol phosphatase SIW14 [Elasticomyces elasticus]
MGLTTSKLPEVPQDGKRGEVATSDPVTGDLAPISVAMVEKLNQPATAKLGEVILRGIADEKEWDGYSEPDLKVAKVLIDSDTQKIER